MPQLELLLCVLAENAETGNIGTLFRSLAVDNFTPEPDDEDLYNPLSPNDRQNRRYKITTCHAVLVLQCR